MSVTIRTPSEADFFPWLGLYEGYAKFYGETLTDQKALVLWSWLTDPAHPESVLVAADDESGELVGLAHFREFPRPLEARTGYFIDDLYVSNDARKAGVGGALIEAVRGLAVEKGSDVVQWITARDNDTARALYDSVAKPTEWVTYELPVGG